MTIKEFESYCKSFDKLFELGFNTQKKLEEAIEVIAKYKNNMPLAIPNLERILEGEVLR